MDYQMEESSRLTEPPPQRHHRGQNYEFDDNECSTDSGCSSGGSTGSAERLSRQSSGDRLCGSGRSPKIHSYLNRLKGRSTLSRTQERLSRKPNNSERVRARYSKSWSPEDTRSHSYGESPLHSQSPSDTHSSDSEASNQLNTFNSLCKVFQGLKVSTKPENSSDKKHSKKIPKRILRTPISYTYVRGLSGLPTQRVPRNNAQQHMMPCACHEFDGLYR